MLILLSTWSVIPYNFSYTHPYDWKFPYIFILVFQYCSMANCILGFQYCTMANQDMLTTDSVEVLMWKGFSEKHNIKL